MPIDVHVKRIYDEPGSGDGYRVLIDHVWPRGVSRERARLDEWARELAPSDDLRRWFAHDPDEIRGIPSPLPRRARRPARAARAGSPGVGADR